MKKFKLLLYVGTSGVTDEEDINRIVFVNKISLFVGIAIAVIGPVICYFLKWKPAVVIPLSIEFVLNWTVLLLNYYKRTAHAAFILYFLQCAAIIYFGIVLGRLLQLEFTIVLLIAIANLIFKGRALRAVALAMAIADLVILEIGYYNDPAQSAIPISYNASFLIHVCVVIGLICLTILVSKPYVKSNDIKNELQRANHLIKIFVAQVTHELRTPLDSIHQVTQLLRKEVQKDENLKKIQSLVDIGYTVSCNARNIVNNVLDMAEIEAGKIPDAACEAFRVIPFFENILEVHRVIAHREDVSLRLQTDEDMPEIIFGDPQNTIQILTNLIANAIKYGTKGTTIDVAIKRCDPVWAFSVSNTGPGIPPDKLKVIFDPFVTGRTGHIQGSGLGLYIVRSKVNIMKGTIEVESRPGNRTTFTVSLPLKEGKLRDLPGVAGPEPDRADLNKVHVLVAEDDKLTSFLLDRYLQEMGCSCTMVKNGQELLDTVEKKCPDDCPDIIIMDCHMPVLNGEQTILALKRMPGLSDIPILFITGDIYSDTIQKMMEAGADAYLKKPIDHAALKSKIVKYRNRITMS